MSSEQGPDKNKKKLQAGPDHKLQATEQTKCKKAQTMILYGKRFGQNMRKITPGLRCNL